MDPYGGNFWRTYIRDKIWKFLLGENMRRWQVLENVRSPTPCWKEVMAWIGRTGICLLAPWQEALYKYPAE